MTLSSFGNIHLCKLKKYSTFFLHTDLDETGMHGDGTENLSKQALHLRVVQPFPPQQLFAFQLYACRVSWSNPN